MLRTRAGSARRGLSAHGAATRGLALVALVAGAVSLAGCEPLFHNLGVSEPHTALDGLVEDAVQMAPGTTMMPLALSDDGAIVAVRAQGLLAQRHSVIVIERDGSYTTLQLLAEDAEVVAASISADVIAWTVEGPEQSKDAGPHLYAADRGRGDVVDLTPALNDAGITPRISRDALAVDGEVVAGFVGDGGGAFFAVNVGGAVSVLPAEAAVSASEHVSTAYVDGCAPGGGLAFVEATAFRSEDGPGFSAFRWSGVTVSEEGVLRRDSGTVVDASTLEFEPMFDAGVCAEVLAARNRRSPEPEIVVFDWRSGELLERWASFAETYPYTRIFITPTHVIEAGSVQGKGSVRDRSTGAVASFPYYSVCPGALATGRYMLWRDDWEYSPLAYDYATWRCATYVGRLPD